MRAIHASPESGMVATNGPQPPRMSSARRTVALRRAAASVIHISKSDDFIEADQRDLPCPVPGVKIFCFTSDPNHRLILGHPVPNEGRFAIVTDVRRDAVDADALLTNSA